MSFTVTLDNNPYTRFKIKLYGIRQSFRVKTTYEVEVALKHYIGDTHDEKNCVLCKEGK